MSGPAAGARRATLVFLAALAYFLLFHRTGFFLSDEGVLAYQALRVSQGQLPYRDFQTAYPPGGYYLHALLFKLGGPSLPLLRVAGSVACAATAGLLALAAGRVLPAPYTLLPSVLYVLLEDQESKGFVTHTIAYPARYVQMLWALSLCLTLAHAARPRRRTAAALGLVTAAIICFKHTGGIYNAWGVGLCLILIGRCRGASARNAGWLRILPLAFLLAVLAALPILFGGFGGVREVVPLVLYLPLALVVVMLLGGAFPWSGDARRQPPLAATGADLVAFGAAALLPTALWVGYFAVRVGPRLLAQRLIFDGPAVAYTYTILFPRPGPLTAGVVVLVAFLLGGRALVRRGALGGTAATRGLGVVSAMLAGAALVWVARLLPHAWRTGDSEVVVMHVGRALDNLGFYLLFVVGFGFLPQLRAGLRRGGSPDPVLLCWLHGVCQLLLAYPRTDVAHLYEALAILLIPGTVLLERTIAFFRAAAHGRARWLPVGASCALAVVGAIKLIPRVDEQLAWHGGVVLEARTPLSGPRGGLYGTGEDGEWLAILNRTVAFVTARTAPGTPIFAYPALAGVYFLSGRENPSPLDYFYHGFGEGRDEVALITALEEKQVPLVIVKSDQSFDPEGAGYFSMLEDYLARHFVQSRSFAGRQSFSSFRVLERVAP